MILILEVDESTKFKFHESLAVEGKVLMHFGSFEGLLEDLERSSILKNMIADGEVSKETLDRWAD